MPKKDRKVKHDSWWEDEKVTTRLTKILTDKTRSIAGDNFGSGPTFGFSEKAIVVTVETLPQGLKYQKLLGQIRQVIASVAKKETGSKKYDIVFFDVYGNENSSNDIHSKVEEIRTYLLAHRYPSVPETMYTHLRMLTDTSSICSAITSMINAIFNVHDISSISDTVLSKVTTYFNFYELCSDTAFKNLRVQFLDTISATKDIDLKNQELIASTKTRISSLSKAKSKLEAQFKESFRNNDIIYKKTSFLLNCIFGHSKEVIARIGFVDGDKEILSTCLSVASETRIGFAKLIDDLSELASLQQSINLAIYDIKKHLCKTEAQREAEIRYQLLSEIKQERIQAGISETQTKERNELFDGLSTQQYKLSLQHQISSKRSAAASDPELMAPSEDSAYDASQKYLVLVNGERHIVELPLIPGSNNFFMLGGLSNTLITTCNLEDKSFSDIIEQSSHRILKVNSTGKQGIKMIRDDWVAVKKMGSASGERLICVKFQCDDLSVYVPCEIVSHSDYESIISSGIAPLRKQLSSKVSITRIESEPELKESSKLRLTF